MQSRNERQKYLKMQIGVTLHFSEWNYYVECSFTRQENVFNILFNQNGSKWNSSFFLFNLHESKSRCGIYSRTNIQNGGEKTRTKNKNKNKNIAHRYSKQRLIRKHFISERLADERECIVELSFKIDIYTILARRSRFDLNEFRDICK